MRKAAVNTKKELNSLLVAERKSMREKQKQSAFMRKTLNIYNGMKKRAAELGRDGEIDFTLEELRERVQEKTGKACYFCAAILRLSNIALDHAIPIIRGGKFGRSNIGSICKSCNWQKGQLTKDEFDRLLDAMNAFPPEARADIKRRLTIGGKWGVRA